MEKKKSIFSLKELIVAYLAISKLMYWMNVIENLAGEQDGVTGVLWAFLQRFLVQDLLTIWILVAMFLIEHYISNHPAITKGWARHILVYGIGYVIYVLSIVGYMNLLALVIYVNISSWAEFILGFSVFYIAACFFLSAKEHVKKKEAVEILQNDADAEKSKAMLSALLTRGILTQAEYLDKIEKLEEE